MVEIERRGWTPASPEVTWAVLADHAHMAAWAPVRSATLEDVGDPLDGVGAIRVLKISPLTVREQITVVEAPHRLDYTVVSGLPVRDYQASTVLSGRDGGTDIVWTVSMQPRIPGLALVVRRSIRQFVEGLVKESSLRAS